MRRSERERIRTQSGQIPAGTPRIFCPLEISRLCGAPDCHLARLGKETRTIIRDGGERLDEVPKVRGRIVAVVFNRRCTPEAVKAYVPAPARPSSIPARR